jgi:ATP-dependent Clp protease ATP-binding subunit ClpA
VLLLDEIEKAHPDVFNVLLQVMDHGTLTDNNGKKADFRHVVLIMTSNVGAQDLARGLVGFGQRDTSGNADIAMKNTFSPEFRNRLDAIVNFRPLTPDVMETIVDKFIIQLEEQLAERRIAITLQPDARAYLAKKGYDPLFGARPLARVIQAEVRDRLTDEILFGALENGGTVTIGLEGTELTFSFA